MRNQHQAQLPHYFSDQITAARRFHLRAIHQPVKALRVLSGGLERCRDDYDINRRGFPHPILEFVAAGAGQLVMNGERFDLGPGTVFTYGRGLPHRITSDGRQPLVKYFIVLAGVQARRVLADHGLAPGRVVRVAEPDRIRMIFDDLIDFALGDRKGLEISCTQTLQYLLLKISDLVVPVERRAALAFATYERCRAYIETHSPGVTEIRDVARACHVDSAYLCRLFQRFGRESPFHYLQHLRMNRAAALLQTGDRLIKDIALDLGFSDAANFTRAFRRWYGVPPQRMRSDG
jgi:AraC-like DNA-binding protein